MTRFSFIFNDRYSQQIFRKCLNKMCHLKEKKTSREIRGSGHILNNAEKTRLQHSSGTILSQFGHYTMEGVLLNIVGSLPICTRIWTGLILLASFLVSANAIKSVDLVFVTSFYANKEYWRIITSFIYFGPFDINLLNWLIHLSEHSSSVEHSFFRTRDYIWFMFLNMVFILLYSNYIENSHFLGPEMIVSTTYYWCRKNPDMNLSLFFGLIHFKAQNYPFSIIFFGLLRQGFSKNLLTELCGLFAGHLMFYFEDVFPKLFGFKPLQSPWDYLQNRRPQENYNAGVNDAPNNDNDNAINDQTD